MYSRFCLVCDKSVGPDAISSDEAINPDFHIPPNSATVWTAHGNYGSTLYDPMGDEGSQYLECYVCDSCLKTKSKQVYRVKTKTEKKYNVKAFSEVLEKELEENK